MGDGVARRRARRHRARRVLAKADRARAASKARRRSRREPLHEGQGAQHRRGPRLRQPRRLSDHLLRAGRRRADRHARRGARERLGDHPRGRRRRLGQHARHREQGRGAGVRSRGHHRQGREAGSPDRSGLPDRRQREERRRRVLRGARPLERGPRGGEDGWRIPRGGRDRDLEGARGRTVREGPGQGLVEGGRDEQGPREGACVRDSARDGGRRDVGEGARGAHRAPGEGARHRFTPRVAGGLRLRRRRSDQGRAVVRAPPPLRHARAEAPPQHRVGGDDVDPGDEGGGQAREAVRGAASVGGRGVRRGRRDPGGQGGARDQGRERERVQGVRGGVRLEHEDEGEVGRCEGRQEALERRRHREMISRADDGECRRGTDPRTASPACRSLRR